MGRVEKRKKEREGMKKYTDNKSMKKIRKNQAGKRKI